MQFKKTMEEEGASGTLRRGIDAVTGDSIIGRVAGGAVKLQTYLASKGLDVLLASAKRLGFDPIQAIPNNLGNLIINAFKDFANKVFSPIGETSQTTRPVNMETRQVPRRTANAQQGLQPAAMRNK